MFLLLYNSKSIKFLITSTEAAIHEIGVLKNFLKLTGNDLCRSLYFNKVESLQRATLLKKRPRLRCFPLHFATFLKVPLRNILEGCFCIKNSQNCNISNVILNVEINIVSCFFILWGQLYCILYSQQCGGYNDYNGYSLL